MYVQLWFVAVTWQGTWSARSACATAFELTVGAAGTACVLLAIFGVSSDRPDSRGSPQARARQRRESER